MLDNSYVIRQLEIMNEKISELNSSVAVQQSQHSELTKSIQGLRDDVDIVSSEVSEIKEYADRWRGGFYAITGFGAAIGALAAFWDKIKGAFA